MRYPASEKLEIIRIVEQSHLPVTRTLDKLGIPKTTFYRWYDCYLALGEAGLEDRSPHPGRVWRCRIVLLSADGRGAAAIMAATAKSKTCVWRWQERFMHEGVDGLLREKTRPPGIARTPDGKVADVIRLTQAPPPHEATHWTIRAMGKAVGLAASTVRSIWKAHGLSPHRWRQFKLSNDPAFAQKLQDVVGLYVAPPAHAVVLSLDEKSQIQALDRTQPGLPLKKGRRPTMTHDYKRNSLPRT